MSSLNDSASNSTAASKRALTAGTVFSSRSSRFVSLFLVLCTARCCCAFDGDPAISARPAPAEIAAQISSDRDAFSSFRGSGGFTTTTSSDDWKIISAGRFELVNFKRRLLLKTELEHFQIKGSPPDYLREVALQSATLDHGVGGLYCHALFGFRRAFPIVKVDSARRHEGPRSNPWNYLHVDHGHVKTDFGNREDEPVVATLIIPEIAIESLKLGEWKGTDLIRFEAVSATQHRTIRYRAEGTDRTLVLQSLDPVKQLVRLETVGVWQRTDEGLSIPRQLKTDFRHSSSWNWSLTLDFEQVESIDDVPSSQFELSSMLFEPMTFTDDDPPHRAKAYQLLKQLHAVGRR